MHTHAQNSKVQSIDTELLPDGNAKAWWIVDYKEKVSAALRSQEASSITCMSVSLCLNLDRRSDCWLFACLSPFVSCNSNLRFICFACLTLQPKGEAKEGFALTQEQLRQFKKTSKWWGVTGSEWWAVSRVAQNHTFIGMYGVHTVFLARKSPCIRSYTVQIYSSGQP